MMVLKNLSLHRDGNQIWIRDLTTGEGGSFPLPEFEALVEKYFVENF